MTFLIRRGRRAVTRRASAHVARFNQYGEIAGAWCWRSGFDLSSNVPWGLRVCKDCRRRMGKESDDG